MGVSQAKRRIRIAPAENVGNAEAIPDNGCVIFGRSGERRAAVEPAQAVFIRAEEAEERYPSEQQ